MQAQEETGVQAAYHDACIGPVAGQSVGKDAHVACETLIGSVLDFKVDESGMKNVDDLWHGKCGGTLPTKKFVTEQQIVGFTVDQNVKGWTVLVQVVERNNIFTSQKDAFISYRRFQFVDSEGTEVATVAYNNNIRESSPMLQLYKRYYVSGAALKMADPKYMVGSYPFSWTITNRTLIQPCEDKLPEHLDCQIQCEEFGNLHKFVDTEHLQNFQGMVALVFEMKDVGVDAVNMDIVLVNQEMVPMILTLWNGFGEIEGSQLAQTINAGNVVVAMRVKVTTFHALSLSTRTASSILINPPTPDAAALKHWYLQNKEVVSELIATEAYKNPVILLPPPKSEDIKTIATLLSPNNGVHTAWIQGSVAMGHVDQQLWFGACMLCLKKFDPPVDSEIRCSSCNKDNQIVARARIPITIEDVTGTIAAVVYGEDGEKLISHTAAQLEDADAQGVDLLEKSRAEIKGTHGVAFVRSYQANGTAYAVVKLYVDAELADYILPVSDECITQESPLRTEAEEETKVQVHIEAAPVGPMGTGADLACDLLTGRHVDFKGDENGMKDAGYLQHSEGSGTCPTKKVVTEQQTVGGPVKRTHTKK
ncbi:Unknown protein [Striga hermonthica]|uniref:Replication factor A C-terminal domain-containing protein n=1 Tax=Striga hermonthica TaxID=68872 RepID=A0A9N7MIY8_STRHE|nr:Unknown protein [Striga hermonthica]